jgi:hypothetical protein
MPVAKYLIGKNEATCNDLNKGLRADRGCKTAFLIEEEPEAGCEAVAKGVASGIQSRQWLL